MTIVEAYERASEIFAMLIEGKLIPSMAKYRLEEINAKAGVHIRCDIPYLTEVKKKHQTVAVFDAMKDDDDYESSSEYDSSEN